MITYLIIILSYHVLFLSTRLFIRKYFIRKLCSVLQKVKKVQGLDL